MTGEAEQEITGTTNQETIIKHPKFFFDNTLIVIQIENVQFNVHKYQLLKSETFADMFKIAEESGEIQKIQQKESDRIVFPSYFSTHQPEPTASLIIPAFRLANMWNFKELRDYLMPLAEQVLNDASKIAFAREFHVQQWIVPAFVRLCHREEPLDTDEAKMIGLEGVLLISRIREGRYTKNPRPSCHTDTTAQIYCSSCEANYGMGDLFMSEEESEEEINKWVEWRIENRKHGRFATKPAGTQNSDLAGACSESRGYRFMPCRLASDLHCLVWYTPSAAARICVSFLSQKPSLKVKRAGLGRPPTSRARGRAPPVHPRCFTAAGSPNFTGLGLVANADERAEDKFKVNR
ncbi:hypothetical protein RHS01_05896 [Rhizoctonia solani]|uniref:BTB domain-containing protein n=1 Tax=Rhizoctonia solani TaxID=456999 RepID=A0A8H7I9Z8_9AGAM|nr:hypothetical protein RHS01_05896 [Rhizoctonia solani]